MPHSTSSTECFLCGQIAGDARRDLLAQMLPSLPYRRRVIIENRAFAVIPSLGALTPGHVLLCPKTHAPSFAQLGGGDECIEDAFFDLKARLKRLLEQRFAADVHIFEHGMAATGTHIPCTVDHAHLHFIPVPHFVEVSPGTSKILSTRDSSLAALAARTAENEYLLHETPDGLAHISTGPPGSFPSQSMRRRFAASLGCDELWNWRTSPQPERADEIWQALHSEGACDRSAPSDIQIVTSSMPLAN